MLLLLGISSIQCKIRRDRPSDTQCDQPVNAIDLFATLVYFSV